MPDSKWDVITIPAARAARMGNADESHQELSNEGEARGPRATTYNNPELGRALEGARGGPSPALVSSAPPPGAAAFPAAPPPARLERSVVPGPHIGAIFCSPASLSGPLAHRE